MCRCRIYTKLIKQIFDFKTIGFQDSKGSGSFKVAFNQIFDNRNVRTGEIQGFGLSIGATAALASLGVVFDVGFVQDQNSRTGFISFGNAIGLDFSLEANGFIVQNRSHFKNFEGTDFRGLGASLNAGATIINGSVGGDFFLDNNNIIQPRNNFRVTKFGVNLSPLPASFSGTVGKTVTFPMLPLGLITLTPGF